MRIFVSHSSQDKLWVKNIVRKFPSELRTWLDEEELIIGDDLKSTLEDAINEECDFVIIFLSEHSISSKWVKQELKWALEKEKELKRKFVLPVLLGNVQNITESTILRNRKYLHCYDQNESESEKVAQELSKHIVKYILGWMEKINVDRFSNELCQKYCTDRIQQVLFDLLPTASQDVLTSLNSLKLILLAIPNYPKSEFSNILKKCIHKSTEENTSVGYEKSTKVPYYIRLADLATDSLNDDIYKSACIMAKHIKDTCKTSNASPVKIARSKTETIEINEWIAQLLRLSLVYVTPMKDNLKLSIEGSISPQDEIVLLHDVAVSGNTILKCVFKLREMGAKVSHLFTFVEYKQKYNNLHELMRENDLNFHPLISLDQIQIEELIRSSELL